MNIIVLNGSPKGELSVTLQSVAYLAKLYPQHEFTVHHIAQRVRRLEKDRAAFDEVIRQIRERAFEKLRESPDVKGLKGFWVAA